MKKEDNNTAQKLSGEFFSDEKLSIPLHKLNALFDLLGHLGWSIASQDDRNHETYHVYGPSRAILKGKTISNFQLRDQLQQIQRIHYLHQSEDLLIWRIPIPTIENKENSFSRREREVYNLLISGQTLNAMAKELGISKRTIEKHVENIYKKKAVRSYNELLFKK